MSIVATLRAERAAKKDQIERILNTRGATYSTADDARVEELFAEVNALDERITDLSDLEARDAANAAARRQLGNADTRTERVGGARVYEQPTYRSAQGAGSASGHEGPSYLRDLYASQVLRDPQASERLARHGREVEASNPHWTTRAVSTGAVSGFVPPAYVTERWAEYARAGRPTANLCERLPLPPTGMIVNLPRITTPSLVDVQTAENATIANQDLDDSTLAVPVRTIAGYTDLSRQAVERGELVEQMAFADLAASYNAALDAQVINGTGANGQHLGILNVAGTNTVTYTDASPTIGELWPKLASAFGQIVSNRYTGATAVVMHPTAWAWLLSATDTTGRPLLDASATASNPLAISVQPNYELQSVGSVFGVAVVLDGNMPTNLGTGTNETRVVVGDMRDCLLFEDHGGAPTQLKFEEVLSDKLGIRLVAYGYSAFCAGRQPTAISVVSGTGLIVPAL